MSSVMMVIWEMEMDVTRTVKFNLILFVTWKPQLNAAYK